MEQNALLACLLDFYGPLLTKRQRELMHLRVEEDLTLSEIADELLVSRQAVSDGLKGAQVQLMRLEETLRFFERRQRTAETMRRAIGRLDQGDLCGARRILSDLVEEENDGL